MDYHFTIETSLSLCTCSFSKCLLNTCNVQAFILDKVVKKSDTHFNPHEDEILVRRES